MTIYRPPKPRWRIAVATGALGLLVGGLIGAIAFGGTEPDPAEAIAKLRASLRTAAGALDVIPTEYAESVRDGAIVSEPEYRGARSAFESSRTAFRGVAEDLASLDPTFVRRIEDGYTELGMLMDSKAAADRVAASVAALVTLLTGGA